MEVEAEAELKVSVLQEMVGLIHTFHELHNADLDCGNLRRIQQEMTEVMASWRSMQAGMNSQIQDLQQQVARGERRVASARVDGSNHEELAHVREQLLEAQARERQIQTDPEGRVPLSFATDLEECIEAIEQQMISIKSQKETLEKPDGEEAFLKNELSLFLNVSSILPDLGDPKFSGTFVDKRRGVKTFKFLSAEMSQFETCNAAWDMMR